MKIKRLLIGIIVVCFSLFFCVGATACNFLSVQEDSEQETIEREVQKSDISDIDFTGRNRSVSIRIIPKYDIKELKVTVRFLDSEKDVLDSQIITVGDVIANQSYVIETDITENGFTKDKKIGYYSLAVYSGTTIIPKNEVEGPFIQI